MNLLERLGLRSKKPRPVGQTLERHKNGPPKGRRRGVITRGLCLFVLLLITVWAFPRDTLFRFAVDVGEEWRRDTLEAPFSFPIYKDPDSLAVEQAAARQRVPPYFREVEDVQAQMQANRDTIAAQLDELYDAYQSMVFNRQRGRTAQAAQDSARFLALRRQTRVKLTSERWQALLDDWRQRLPGADAATRGEPPTGPRLDERLLEDAWRLGTQFANTGVLDVPLDSVQTAEIIVRNEEERTERMRRVEHLYGIQEVYAQAQEQYRALNADMPPEELSEQAALHAAFFSALFEPSYQYLRGESMRRVRQRVAGISPTRGLVEEGDVIVSEGQRVTPEIQRQLASLERAQEQRAGPTIVWRRVSGQTILSIVVYFIFFLYLFLLRRSIFETPRFVVLTTILFGVLVICFGAALRLPQVAMFAVPIAIVPVLLTVVFDSRVGVFGALTLASVGALMLGFDFVFFLASLFAAVLAVFSVRDIKNRAQFFISAGLVLVGYAVVLVAAWLVLDTSTERLTDNLVLAIINAFLLTLAYPLLWVVERSFGVTTDVTLLELSDTNRELLKELSMRAPGTFQHVLQVANLAEAAAGSIEANALLTRVGALYHDIGKMTKPEYFVENQRGGHNPHDQQKPRMSALIIASHVKEGLELARKHRLPQRVIDFIPMHHGTTRIEYFYRRAQEQRGEHDPSVSEAEFRYPGPRPQSRETGILMLADSVEAASRSLSDPTHKRLETLIDTIFRARMDDGQLDDTDLTFKDLRTIKQTFLNMLLGVHHTRVKYPEPEEAEEEKGAPEQPPAEPEVEKAPAHASEHVEDVPGVVGIPEQSVQADGDEEGEGTEKRPVGPPPSESKPAVPKHSDAEQEDLAEHMHTEERAQGDGAASDGNAEVAPSSPEEEQR